MTDKAFTTMQARFALLGHEMRVAQGGGFVVTISRLGAHFCPDAAALASLLLVLGGVK